ncbi:MAG: hypothetical protein K6E72_05335 [Saccharofermentans sp.]|nr:hypothetical protein [Saccharofermentans sp.]
MKMIRKMKDILKERSGETIVEVMVAFILLSIMMVIFSQSLASATTAEVNASKSRNNADTSLIDLKKKLASDSPTSDEGNIKVSEKNRVDVGTGSIKTYAYTVNGNTYIVYMPVTDSNG